MTTKRMPPLSLIANAVLKTRSGEEVLGSTLWANRPCAILVLRRPGCVLCREEAQQLWGIKPALDRLGVDLVCVVHEWIEREINAFSPAFWPGPLYHDPSKSFYSAVNGGHGPLRGSMLGLLVPWSDEWKRIRNAAKSVKEHNVVGDGLTMGGALLVRAGEGGVAWSHLEERLGMVADPAAVLAQAEKLAAAGQGAAAGGKGAKGGVGAASG